MDHDLDDAAMVAMVVVKGEFVGDPQADEQGDGHTGGEAGDIDKRIRLVSLQVTYGDGKKVSEHAVGFGNTAVVQPEKYLFFCDLIIN